MLPTTRMGGCSPDCWKSLLRNEFRPAKVDRKPLSRQTHKAQRNAHSPHVNDLGCTRGWAGHCGVCPRLLRCGQCETDAGDRKMAAPGVTIGSARAGEERRRTGFAGAMLDHLGRTPEQAAWCEAATEALWEYDGMSPLRAAALGWRRGNRELNERARADDARLTRLAEAAWGPE